MTIRLTDIFSDFVTGKGGLEIGQHIDGVIKDHINQPVYISLYGIDYITPSFINGTFLYILDLYGEEYFRNYIKVREAAPQVAQLIRDSISKHFEYKKQFYAQLKTNRIYAAIIQTNFSELIYRNLQQSLQANNIELYTSNNPSVAENYIGTCDSVMGIIAHRKELAEVLERVNYALKLNKPSILIIAKGVDVRIPDELKDKIQILWFDSENLPMVYRNLNEIIIANKVNPPTHQAKSDNTFEKVVLWSALGVAAIALLAAISKK